MVSWYHFQSRSKVSVKRMRSVTLKSTSVAGIAMDDMVSREFFMRKSERKRYIPILVKRTNTSARISIRSLVKSVLSSFL